MKVEVSIFMYFFGQLNNMILIDACRAADGEDLCSSQPNFGGNIAQNYVKVLSLSLSLTPVFPYVIVCLPSIEQL